MFLEPIRGQVLEHMCTQAHILNSKSVFSSVNTMVLFLMLKYGAHLGDFSNWINLFSLTPEPLYLPKQQAKKQTNEIMTFLKSSSLDHVHRCYSLLI